MVTFTFMFLINDILVGSYKTVLQALELRVHVMHMLFMFFTFFMNLKSSFSEGNMPVHALDIFIENATKMV